MLLLIFINIEEVQKRGATSCLQKYAGEDTHTHWCHFHEWIEMWITRRDQQYMAWLKKVDEDVRNCERAKADRAGHDKGTGRE